LFIAIYEVADVMNKSLQQALTMEGLKANYEFIGFFTYKAHVSMLPLL
jgi:hypothetical protein